MFISYNKVQLILMYSKYFWKYLAADSEPETANLRWA